MNLESPTPRPRKWARLYQVVALLTLNTLLLLSVGLFLLNLVLGIAFSVWDKHLKMTNPVSKKYGEALLTAGQYDRAAKEFLASAEVPAAQAGLATMAHLQAAHALDLAGKRNDAVAQYRAVLSRPNVYDAHEQAQTGLKEAFKKKLS